MPRIGLLSALITLAAGHAFAAGSPGVEHNTQAFLQALEAGGGKPLEALSPLDARAVLVGAQASVKVDLSGV
ncbi:MAG TPA: alpha/beta hydrolase, partial [Pseudomonas sp.]|nr:alpha/beta hydrolase [Pseudomonas sp.]